MHVETNLGFITVVEENGGYLGGFLVTNSWGRPLEFRLTTAVQPNRVQQILYGSTLKPYIFAELIGKTLIERAGVAVRLLCTNCEPMLDLRLHAQTPVAWLTSFENPLAQALEKVGAGVCRTEAGPLLCHPRFSDDARAVQGVLDGLDPAVDLGEPFARIREALTEARKTGAAGRAA